MTVTIYCGDRDVEVQACVTVLPGEPATMWEPGCGPEVELEQAWVVRGERRRKIDLPDRFWEQLEEAAIEAASDAAEAAREDRAEARRRGL